MTSDFNELLHIQDGLQVYDAGLPRFPRNFTRDSVIAAMLADDVAMMRGQLQFCALHQGGKNDPETGEEPGKIHHEFPGYLIRDKMTTYNACDAAAFYLIGHGWLQQQAPDVAFLADYRESIGRAADYIETHLNEQGLFAESPAFCGADRFALRVTYWKDSVILDREGGEPVYPAVYTLAHLQNLCGMRHAASLLDSDHLREVAAVMKAGIPHLFNEGEGTFFSALDAAGPIAAVSSDALHGLYYLERDDLTAAQVTSIVLASERLESQIGYMLMTPEDGRRMARIYHANTVWPFEQALIHAGAKKFGLARVMRVCERVKRMIQHDSPELLAIQIEEPEISSNPQLWTIAARGYFGG